ncbi:ArsR/SmtB family transcription factor [Halosimplex amylolyticum]|uniref:ArsR/SmtB family transcription factor n=1 Tax=Halosimplex amylolyticum TaxID=3396616 RepID=UPI003F54ED2E
MPDGVDSDSVLSLLGDEYVREILSATSRERQSVKELADRCDVALSTVYRRLEEMEAYGLVAEETAIAPDGSHHSVYVAAVDHLDVEVDDGRIEVALTSHDTPSERFTRIWEDIRET